MNYRYCKIRSILVVVIIAALLSACGFMATDAPAIAAGEDSSDENGDPDTASDERDGISEEYEVTVHPFEVDAESTTESTSDDDPSCPQLCVKVLWCQEGAGQLELADCLDACESGDTIVGDSIHHCVDGAETCDETRQCSREIGQCNEICDVFSECLGFQERRECTQWCSSQAWGGRVDTNSYDCLIEESVGGCPNVEFCGLKPPQR